MELLTIVTVQAFAIDEKMNSKIAITANTVNFFICNPPCYLSGATAPPFLYFAHGPSVL
jgi:hypothetical protein